MYTSSSGDFLKGYLKAHQLCRINIFAQKFTLAEYWRIIMNSWIQLDAVNCLHENKPPLKV
jgi:hypothetical protein